MKIGPRSIMLAGALILLVVGVAAVAFLWSEMAPAPEAATAAATTPSVAQASATAQASAEATESANAGDAPATQTAAIAPYPEAPLCPDSAEAHDNSRFHTLWDGVRGCHYDHEHGQFPFLPEVAAAFPAFDLRTLLGGVEIGHTNPSSEMENSHKHGGFKWDVTLTHASGCAGREMTPTGVDALVVQYHAFGNYAVEFESRIHSAVALMRQCQTANPADYGYIFINQHQDFGQRVAPYQGAALTYPDTPMPAYDPVREPYFSVDCFGGAAPCDKYPTLSFVVERQASADSTWISEPTNLSGSGSPLFALLFRVRDTYQVLDATDTSYPFTFAWLCSTDGGATYSPVAGCGYNNSTTRVHEVMGDIPLEWDNLAGFDSDPRPGRVTAEGFVSRFGVLSQECTSPGPDCHPLKLVQAFTGRYGSSFTLVSGAATFGPDNLPERDISFCDGQVCAENDSGATPSGWIGPNN